jgi:hypothetical protein
VSIFTICVAAFSAFANIPGRVSTSSVAMPLAIATGLPLSVPAWYIEPDGATCSHEVAPPAVGPDRHAAAEDLAEGGEIGRHADRAPARHRSPPGSR